MGESIISCSIYTYFYTNCLSTNNRKFSPIRKRKALKREIPATKLLLTSRNCI